MPSRPAERLAARYRTRAAGIRARVDERLARLYGDLIDPAAIDASFARFMERAAPLIEAGQASTARLAAAFVASVAAADLDEALEPADDEDAIPGTTRAGRTLRDGMAAIGPMILAHIGAGHTPGEALEFGRYLVGRFADGELTGAADRELEVQGQALGPLVGWEGIISPDACDPCLENAGEHELTWRPYRHGACQCTVVPVFSPEAAA